MDEQLGKIVVAGEQVRETLETQGWKKYVGPLLEQMIKDIVGGFNEGRYDNGLMDDIQKPDHEMRNLMIYKTALVDFHNRVNQFIDDMEDARQELAKVKEQAKYTSDYEVEIDE